MYLRYLLLISTVSIVVSLQVPTLSSPQIDTQSSSQIDTQATKEVVTKIERHPNQMSLFETLAFMEELTGYTYDSWTTTLWYDCSNNEYEVVGWATNEEDMCSSRQQYSSFLWLNDGAWGICSYDGCTSMSLPF